VLAILGMRKGVCSWKKLKDTMIDSTRLCGMIAAFIFGGGVFGLFINMSGVIPPVVEFVKNLNVPPIITLSVILLLYIPIGTFLDPVSMIIVCTPLSYPIVVNALGYDPIWFGVVLVILIEIAVVTPPDAINLYIVKAAVPEVPLSDIFWGSAWFLWVEVLLIVILVAFPQICTWLPSMMR
jgi:TRAP-type C4-dicarboxylate transport system permease large subunit